MFGKLKESRKKGEFSIAGVTFACRDLCEDRCDGWSGWRRTGAPGKTIGGEICAASSVPAVYRLLSEPISTCLVSFLLPPSSTAASAVLFVTSVGLSCKVVKVKRALELRVQVGWFLLGRRGKAAPWVSARRPAVSSVGPHLLPSAPSGQAVGLEEEDGVDRGCCRSLL